MRTHRLMHAVVVGLIMLRPCASGAQHLRRTDAITQDDIASAGFSSDLVCEGSSATTPGTVDPLPDLSGASAPLFHVAAAATGVAERLQPTTASAGWRGGGIAQLRAHHASGCHFDAFVRAMTGSGGVGGDILLVLHRPGVLRGALHGFLELAAANDSVASDRLAIPRGAELGVAYTTFNLMELVPFFRTSDSHAPRIDLRARLSAGALLEYAGDARRVHGKSIVPEYGASIPLVVHEKVNSGLIYTVRAIPGYVARERAAAGVGRTLWEQSVVLDHGIISPIESSFIRHHQPFVGARYTWRRLLRDDERYEFAVHAGIHLL